MRFFVALFVWFVCVAPRARSAEVCPDVIPQSRLRDTLSAAETAMGQLDVETFLAAMDTVAFEVPCLGEVLDRPTIARLHRLQGIRQFVANDEDRAALAFAAARSIEPNYALPTWLVPDGHALRGVYGLVPLENAQSARLPAPRTGSLLVDGQEGLDRPTRWPTFVQVLNSAGQPMASAYLFPGDAPPAYAAAPDPISTATPVPPAAPRRIGLALGGGALAAGAASGALYGLAAANAADLRESHPDWDLDDLERARGRTNGLLVGSGVAAVAGLGLGSAALILVRW